MNRQRDRRNVLSGVPRGSYYLPADAKVAANQLLNMYRPLRLRTARLALRDGTLGPTVA
jgi:hypothetical protein